MPMIRIYFLRLNYLWTNLRCCPFYSYYLIGFNVSNQIEILEFFKLPTLTKHTRPCTLKYSSPFFLGTILNVKHIARNIIFNQSCTNEHWFFLDPHQSPYSRFAICDFTWYFITLQQETSLFGIIWDLELRMMYWNGAELELLTILISAVIKMDNAISGSL